MPIIDQTIGQTSSQALEDYLNPAGTPVVPNYPDDQIISGDLSELGAASNAQGVKLVEDAKAKETKIIPPPPPAPTDTAKTTDTPKAPEAPTKGLTLEEAFGLFGQDFTGVRQNSDGTYTPDSSALARLSVKTSAKTPVEQAQYEANKANYDSAVLSLTNFQSAMDGDPALQRILSGVKGTWDARIRQQEQSNASQTASIQTAGLRFGSLRYGGGSAGPMAGIISATERAGMDEIAKLTSAKDSALAAARSAYESQKWDQYVKLVDLAEKKYSESKAAVAKLVEAQAEVEKKRKEAEVQSKKDNAIADALESGLSSPADILKKVKGNGLNVNLKDISDALSSLHPEEKDIVGILKEAAKNGAPESVRKSIASAKTAEDAINASSGWLQTATGDLGEYLQYKRDAEAAGQVPESWQAYKEAADKAKMQMEINKAVAIKKAEAKIAGEATVNDFVTPSGVEGSILSATGLSVPAFSFLTQGTSALTRMPADLRIKYMNEAQNYLNKNGVDLSTFQAQYKAIGQTVNANSLRNNQAEVAESELKATLDNLQTAADDASFGNMKWKNIVKMFAGSEFNDKNVSKYSFHLNQLREEFAMYNAALSGQIDANGNLREITGDDRRVAEEIIKNGFAEGSITGFESALTASRQKMKTVLDNSINAQNKKVWNLFGVGDKYKPMGKTGDSLIEAENTAKQSVLDYGKSHPETQNTIRSLALEVNPDTGKPLTYQEIKQVLGIQ